MLNFKPHLALVLRLFALVPLAILITSQFTPSDFLLNTLRLAPPYYANPYRLHYLL